ncbi:hypothetical protein OIU77_008187 [Salix suchowensis]|uniref:Uncharacterized protein n=2 Tax=Salix TaxID=40685 RepID=A0A9Q0W6E1_SALPP|nr:hypothetical protein OIU77_008187 [Salix suchowensis]KAJ6373855.1 hypothetical protein OIU78_029529 [Salix suchowensis]KAJ6759850.1 hypothetical protein OIU79_024834 [Salix purpurea]
MENGSMNLSSSKHELGHGSKNFKSHAPRPCPLVASASATTRPVSSPINLVGFPITTSPASTFAGVATPSGLPPQTQSGAAIWGPPPTQAKKELSKAAKGGCSAATAPGETEVVADVQQWMDCEGVVDVQEGNKVARHSNKAVLGYIEAIVDRREGLECEVTLAATWDNDKAILVCMEAIEVQVEQHIDPKHIQATLLEDGWTKVKCRRSNPHCQPRSRECPAQKPLGSG